MTDMQTFERIAELSKTNPHKIPVSGAASRRLAQISEIALRQLNEFAEHSGVGELQKEFPPTIIAFPDAMRLLKMARDAFNDGDADECQLVCAEIAKAFGRND